MEYLTNDVELTSIAEAIREKGGTTEQLIYPEGFVSAINNIPTGGGGGSVDSSVVFIDYDGTIVDSWEAETVASKTSLPANPTHTGLVAEGWNWSLVNIQSYILKYPNAKVIVGQMYHTTSGLTEMDITITKVTGKDVVCNMVGNKNWGDGTEDATTSHTYADYDNYTITCDGTSIPAGSNSAGGLFGSTTTNNNRYWCTAIRIGGSVTSISTYAFNNCYSLTSASIPDSVTSFGNGAVFSSCYSLTSISIPNSVTSISNRMFEDCYSLTSASIPDSATSFGGAVFSNCYPLTSVSIPDGVTSFGAEAFYNCYSLTSVSIPDGVTSFLDYMFGGCHSLLSISIPDGVTLIGTTAFYNCYSLTEYDFTELTAIPTLFNKNAFSEINGICKIIVPDALYDDWIVATNWATYANYIYKASEVA